MSVDPAVHTAASAPLSHYLLADAMARDPFNLESRHAATRRRWVEEELAAWCRDNIPSRRPSRADIAEAEQYSNAICQGEGCGTVVR